MGKVALVTGSSRGIGASIAADLAAAGAQVVVNYVRGREAAQAVCEQIESSGGNAYHEPGDVSNVDDVKTLVARIKERSGRLDVLITTRGFCATARSRRCSSTTGKPSSTRT
jgi:3-oxoacyl-[acyl-carrier protein] reductase